METFADYLNGLENPAHRSRMEEVLTWVSATFPALQPRVAWKQPMFTDHGTYIIGFSAAKNHLAVAPERACLSRFDGDIARSGYERSKELVRIPWGVPVDYALLKKLIAFNIEDKAEHTAFWR